MWSRTFKPMVDEKCWLASIPSSHSQQDEGSSHLSFSQLPSSPGIVCHWVEISLMNYSIRLKMSVFPLSLCLSPPAYVCQGSEGGRFL